MKPSKTMDERTLIIDKLVNSSIEFKSLPFKKSSYKCPIIEVAPEYLIYRIENTRTISKQREYIAENDSLSNFFSPDRLEVEEVQKAQHEILKTEVDDELRKAYEMQGGQVEPILISMHGVVINGNRRLCLMRQNNQALITCQVLVDPNLNGKDAEIEAWIDIAPNAKKEYEWHAVGLSMIELSNKGFSNKEIAEIKGFINPKEVERRMKATKMAEEQLFLQGKQDKWSIVDGTKQTYEDNASKKIPDPIDRKVAELTTIAINVASNEAAGTRRYEPNNKALNNVKDIRKYFEKIAGNKVQVENQFSGEIESNTNIDDSIIKNIISNPEKVDGFVKSIIEVLHEGEERKADKGKKKLLQTKINAAANSLISAADLTDEPGYETEGIRDLIDNMKISIEKVTKYIES